MSRMSTDSGFLLLLMGYMHGELKLDVCKLALYRQEWVIVAETLMPKGNSCMSAWFTTRVDICDYLICHNKRVIVTDHLIINDEELEGNSTNFTY